MKTYIKLIVITLITALGFPSCVQPTGTPAQQARQTQANAQLAQGVGVGLLGLGATLWGASELRNSGGHDGYYGYGYGGRHYRGYRGHHY
jgi:hypothetical protein